LNYVFEVVNNAVNNEMNAATMVKEKWLHSQNLRVHIPEKYSKYNI